MIRSVPAILQQFKPLVFSTKLNLSSKFCPSSTRWLKQRHFHSSSPRYFNTGNLDELVFATEILVPLGSGNPLIQDSVKEPDQNLPNLFVVHGIEGHVRILNFLGDLLKGPSYGFQLSTKVAGLGMQDVATEYVKALKQVQPEGPYNIGGYSSGAAVAFEILTQLEQQHKDKVSNLILLEGHVLLPKNEFNLDNFVQELITGLFGEIGGHVDMFNNLSKDKSNKEMYPILLEFLRPIVSPEQLEKFKSFFDVFVNYVDSFDKFNPTHDYTGNTLLIKAKDASQTYGLGDPEPKAKKICKSGPLTVCAVEGNHHTFLLPDLVPETADILNDYLYPELSIRVNEQ